MLSSGFRRCERFKRVAKITRSGSLAVLSLVAALHGPAPARADAPATLEVGSLTLARCAGKPLAYCGTLPVPLDYSHPDGPYISVDFRWYPAAESAASGANRTVVPVEGGPGYPSIESVVYPSLGGTGGYSAMYGPLLDRWNMLVVDNRGTGTSTPLACPALQRFSGPTGGAAFQQAASKCAGALNRRWRYPDGSRVHASDLFNSTPAAEDMAAVIRALDVGKVDIYGDSYGSFFAQVFATRFPGLVRSVTLDSTYESVGLDPWYRSSIDSMPNAFDAACERSAACAGAAAGPAWDRIAQLAARLRQSPVSGRVPGPSGSPETVTMDVVGLVDLVSDAAEDTKIYQELDASARALLDAGDASPLLRLYAQREHEDEGYFGNPVGHYSVELYVADACLDYPQLFDMSQSQSVRAQELAGAESALAGGTFAPFHTAEWLSQNENTEAFTVCVGWPSPTIAQPPTDGSLPLFPSTLPVLVLGGELDTWTPPADAPKVLAEIGGHSRFVELANATHVVGEGDTECGSHLVQSFVADPQAIDSLDASCASAVPPLHTVGVYASSLAEEQPLSPSAGSSTPVTGLQLAAAAVSTAGDAIARDEAIEARVDHGLQGGSVTSSHEGLRLSLHRDQLVLGVAVSGTVVLTADKNPLNGYTVEATLSAKSAGVPRGSFTAVWTTAGRNARAQVRGFVGPSPLAGTMPAP